MTAKEYLSDFQWLKEDIKISRKIVENYHISYSSMHGMDYSADKVQSSPKNSLEEAGWKMMEDHQEAVKHLARSICEVNKRLKMIRALSKPIYSEILYQKYYEEKNLNEIAKNLGKDYVMIRKLHGAALADFESKHRKILESVQNTTVLLQNSTVLPR